MKIAKFGGEISKVWWRNVVKYGKCGRAKFANFAYVCIITEKVTVLSCNSRENGNLRYNTFRGLSHFVFQGLVDENFISPG